VRGGVGEKAGFQVGDAAQRLPFPDCTFDAIPCIDGIKHFSDRLRETEYWSRLLRPGGRLLFTDPVIVTGPLAHTEIAARSSIGFFLFVPPSYDERIIVQSGLTLLVSENVTRNVAEIAERRRMSRAARSSALRQIEGDLAYERQQEFFKIAASVAKEGRLSRFVYVSEKPRPSVTGPKHA